MHQDLFVFSDQNSIASHPIHVGDFQACLPLVFFAEGHSTCDFCQQASFLVNVLRTSSNTWETTGNITGFAIRQLGYA